MKKILSLIIFTVFSFTAFSQMRISQVYGAGGNAGATFNKDFIEIFNAGTTSVDIMGWSVQYAAAAGTSWNVTAIPATAPVVIMPGQYYLITEAGGTTGTALTGDLTGTISMAGGAGKVALVNNATALTGACPAGTQIQDFVGYGTTANCSEGSVPTATLTATTAAIRNGNGCTDSNNNGADFTAATPAPRTTASAFNVCPASGSPTLTISSNITGLQATLGAVSPEATFMISGTNLTPAAGNITVTSTGNIEISTASGGTFSNSLTIAYTGGTLAPVTLYARIKNTAPLGSVSETIMISGGGAANASITVTGNVVVAEPATQATDISFTAITNNSFTINFTPGSGAARIVVVRLTTVTSVAPADGVSYTANTAFGTGQTTGTGNFVVYNGTGSGPITITGLAAGTSYTVQVYEYNGTTTSTNYLTATAANNPASQVTTGTVANANLLQQDFTGIAVPLFMAPGNNRLPMMFYATLGNLAPNTAYRYYVLGSLAADVNTTSNGAGVPVLIDYNNGTTFYLPSTASIASATAGTYGTFTTNANGTFSGSFGLIASANVKFTVGNMIYPQINLGVDNGTATTVQQRLQLNQGVTVLNIGTTPADGSYIKGASSATPKNLVALWRSVDGSSFTAATARPLSITYAENVGATSASFITGYDYTAGTWNTLIPNTLPEGVELIQQINLLSGNVEGCSTDADGNWPSADTRNPATGATPLVLSAADAPLTGTNCFTLVAVNLSNFTATPRGGKVLLTWSTEQEVNSKNIEVLRSADGNNWQAISIVQAAGNTGMSSTYSVTDAMPLKGKNLYRLRFNDLAGHSTLSDIKTINFSEVFAFSVSPNPAVNFINIAVSRRSTEAVTAELINSNGAVAGRFTITGDLLRISTTSFSKGVYTIRLRSAEGVSAQKIIIQ